MSEEEGKTRSCAGGNTFEGKGNVTAEKEQENNLGINFTVPIIS